jgi:hypothetical protein
MRLGIALVLGALSALTAVAAATGLTGSLAAGLAAGLACGLVAGGLAFRQPPVRLDESAAPRALRVVAVLGALLTLVQYSRQTVYTLDVTKVGYSIVPSSAWELGHSCLTAYFVAADAASAGNIYDASLFSLPGDPVAPRQARKLGPFNIDVYEYPPPFLLGPRLLKLVVPDFMRHRMVWFALNLGLLTAAMVFVARTLSPPTATRALLLAPLVLCAFPTLNFVQKGNVQGLVIAGSMVAMVLFDRRQDVAGGALLAYATVSKLYPGMLGLYLLLRRQWRPAAITAAFGVAMALATLALDGWPIYAAFLEHLPGLLGGEAFPAFRNPMARAINVSVPGLAFKAGLFGVPAMSFAASKAIGWIYTVVVVWAIVRVARRSLGQDEKPLVWLGILTLATLRSPFLPQGYGFFPPLWILTLLAARAEPTTRTLSLVVLGWVAFALVWPMDWPLDPRAGALLNLVPQTLTFVLAALALRRAPAGERATAAA